MTKTKTLKKFTCMSLDDFRDVFDKIEAAGYDMENIRIKSDVFSGETKLVEMTDSDGEVRYELQLR